MPILGKRSANRIRRHSKATILIRSNDPRCPQGHQRRLKAHADQLDRSRSAEDDEHGVCRKICRAADQVQCGFADDRNDENDGKSAKQSGLVRSFQEVRHCLATSTRRDARHLCIKRTAQHLRQDEKRLAKLVGQTEISGRDSTSGIADR